MPTKTFHLISISISIAIFIVQSQSFSLENDFSRRINQIKSIVAASRIDATTLPKNLLATSSRKDGGNDSIDALVSISSDLQHSFKLEPMTLKQYINYTSNRHRDCTNLFDRYETQIVRCEVISNDNLKSSADNKSNIIQMNIRWNVSWIPVGSLWLYNLADAVGWKVEQKVPDSSQVSTFSWKSVASIFGKAFDTGTIILPVSKVDGSTRFKLVEGKNCNETHLSIVESIDLVREANCGRLQNRKVAQEFASWLDVSRRPMGMSKEEWAAIIRQNVLSGVPGAGPLDVDPNEESENAMVFFIFGALIFSTLALSSNFLLEEIVGGTNKMSDLCDNDARIEVGSGYFSECFGPYKDGPFPR